MQPTLTKREQEALQFVSEGYKRSEIALALHIAPNTVAKHLANAMRKLGARSRAHAVAIAFRYRLLV